MLVISTRIKKLWINCSQDLCDAWSIVREGGHLTFWCIGVGSESDGTQKRGASASDNSAGHASRKRKITTEDKAEQVDEIKAEVKGIHGSKYNELQYRLWSEVVVSGMHTDMHNPPSYPMFVGPRKIPVKQRTNAEASPSTTTAISLASRTMELRGKCITHIKELVELRDAGALTPEEFDKEWQFISRKWMSIVKNCIQIHGTHVTC